MITVFICFGMSSVELLKLVDPALYYSKFISNGVFTDGRPINKFKPFSFKRGVVGGVPSGSALVRQGGVTVVCSLHGTLSPLSTQPSLTIQFETSDDNSDKSALSSVHSLLDELIRREAFFHKSALICSDDRLEWRLEARFRILHSEGDLGAAVVGALLAALTDARLPVVHLAHARDDEAPIDPSEITIEKDESLWLPVKLSAFPVASTFMIYIDEDGKSHLLADPPLDARALCKSECTIVIGRDVTSSNDSNNQCILSLRTSGQCSDDLLTTMISIAENRHENIVKALLHGLR